MLRTVSALCLLASGCTVVDAPDNLEELVVFGFLHFDDDEAFAQSFADGIPARFDDFGAELDEGVRVDSLTADDLVSLGLRPAGEGTDVLGVAARVFMRSTVDEIAEVITGDMSRVVDTTEVYDVAPEGDRDCFIDHTCERFDIAGHRVTSSFLSTATQQFSSSFRWTQNSAGEDVLLFRSTAPDPTETDSVLFKVKEHYSLYALLPHGDGSVKLETHWVDAEIIGLDVPDYFALEAAVQSIQNQADQIDEFVETGS